MDFKKKLMQDMSKRLVAKRKEMSWTQEEAAEHAEVTQQAISDAENAKTMLMPDTMLKLCIAYKISVDYLLTGDVADKDMMILDQKVRELDSKRFFHLSGIIDHFLAAVDTKNTESAK